MSAHDLLTRAAAKVRETAEGTTPGPWTWNSSVEDHFHADAAGWVGHDRTGDGFQEFVASTSDHPDGLNDGDHIALWHPGNALLVAAWLDKTAAVCREAEETPLEIVANGIAEPALALARSILREEAADVL